MELPRIDYVRTELMLGQVTTKYIRPSSKPTDWTEWTDCTNRQDFFTFLNKKKLH